MFVAVEDERLGERLEIPVAAADALDAFHHPFAYAHPYGDDALAA